MHECNHIIVFHSNINVFIVTLKLWRSIKNMVPLPTLNEPVTILGKNGTNGKVGKNGRLVLNLS